MATFCVSFMLPDIATQTLAVVVAGPYFRDGNITTRYGNSVCVRAFVKGWKTDKKKKKRERNRREKNEINVANVRVRNSVQFTIFNILVVG